MLLKQTTNVTVSGCVLGTKTQRKAARRSFAKALKACRKDKNKKKRKACEAAAHKRYGANAKKTKKSARAHAKRSGARKR